MHFLSLEWKDSFGEAEAKNHCSKERAAMEWQILSKKIFMLYSFEIFELLPLGRS